MWLYREMGTLGWLGQKGGTLINGISALKKEIPESSLTPSTVWGHSEKLASYEPATGPLQTLNLLVPWFWTSRPPKLWEINFCCWNHPICGISVIAEIPQWSKIDRDGRHAHAQDTPRKVSVEQRRQCKSQAWVLGLTCLPSLFRL